MIRCYLRPNNISIFALLFDIKTFIFDKEFVDDFLKEQMPLDPDWDDKQEAEKIRKSKLISKKLNESFEQ